MFSKLLFVVATISAVAVAQLPAPTCFDAGIGVSDCSQFIGTFCADVAMSSFDPSDNGARCFSVNGNRCQFIAFREPSVPAGFPIEANCNAVYNNIVQTCPHGGKGKFNNDPNYFIYTLDPNAGNCTEWAQGGGS